MRDGQRRRNRPDRFYEPALTVTTSAPSEVAVAALVDALVAARFRLQAREPGRARLRAGTWLRNLLFDSGDVRMLLPQRFATWGFVATVELETLDTTPLTQVRVRMRGVTEARLAVPHVLRAVDAAARALQAAGHQVEAGEVVEGP